MVAIKVERTIILQLLLWRVTIVLYHNTLIEDSKKNITLHKKIRIVRLKIISRYQIDRRTASISIDTLSANRKAV
jgi:hypothetical protein